MRKEEEEVSEWVAGTGREREREGEGEREGGRERGREREGNLFIRQGSNEMPSVQNKMQYLNLAIFSEST